MQDVVSRVETALYNRMLGNAFTGFLKSAALAAIVGATIGTVLFGCGILSTTLLATGMLESCFGSATLAGAVMTAIACALPAGAFGATAGINATRDARRFMLSHEAGPRSLMPQDIDKPQAIAKPLVEARDAELSLENSGWCHKFTSEELSPRQLH